MRTDLYTKTVLSIIAIFLGLLALGQSKPSVARADLASGDLFQLKVFGTDTGFCTFNTSTGQIFLYSIRDGKWQSPVSGRFVHEGDAIQPQ